MSASAEIALRQAIRNALAADTGVTGLLGGAHIYDEAVETAKLPYAAFDNARVRDWSTATSTGAEHQLGITLYTEGKGVLQSLQIAAAICECLQSSSLALTGHHLILLRENSLTTTRSKRGRIVSAKINFRALTEVA